jgi:hypothetical protein
MTKKGRLKRRFWVVRPTKHGTFIMAECATIERAREQKRLFAWPKSRVVRVQDTGTREVK